MKHPKTKPPSGRILSFFACILLSCATLFGSTQSPVKIILDTDMGNDVDDVLALALIHSLQNRGECELLAITLTNPDPLAVPYTSVINRFYGRPDIPIGFTPDAPFAYDSKYLRMLEKKDSQGNTVYLPTLDAKDAWDSLKLLRKTLAESPDGEIVIVQVGFSTNLARLLGTKGDAYSPLSGMELVKKKVRMLSVMGGMFPKDTARKPEFNIIHDIPSASKLIQEWPTPIIWNGFELGKKVCFPAQSIRDFSYTTHHPVRDSYLLYGAMPYERPLWDLISILHAVRPDHDYYTLSDAGRTSVEKDGRTVFQESKEGQGRDRYIKLDATQALRMREILASLVSEPPVIP